MRAIRQLLTNLSDSGTSGEEEDVFVWQGVKDSGRDEHFFLGRHEGEQGRESWRKKKQQQQRASKRNVGDSMSSTLNIVVNSDIFVWKQEKVMYLNGAEL